MPWLRHFVLFLFFVTVLFRPAGAEATCLRHIKANLLKSVGGLARAAE